MTMAAGLKIAFFGSSLVSAYWNGAATYYRGIIRALAARGHSVTFYEPDAFDRQRHRDLEDPLWAKVVVYRPEEHAARVALSSATSADVLVKASGVGVLDEFLEREILAVRRPYQRAIFWDVDAPATLDRLHTRPDDPFLPLAREYDQIFTYGGGPPVVRGYLALGAKRCTPIYNALDPETHHPVEAAAHRPEIDLMFIGNRLPDREKRVDEFFFKPAELLAQSRFTLGGNGWGDRCLPSNVHYIGHVYTADHNRLNCGSLAVLNVNRESMARYGYSPPTRFFEAAGAGACVLSDAWEGIELFLEPDTEILIARNGTEVASHLSELSVERARRIGAAARRRLLAEHTYAKRAIEVEHVLDAPSRGEA
jgi:spore maturation protein CgeB